MQDIESLIKRAQKDENAFREVYDYTFDRVFKYVLLRVKDREDTKEIVQDIYLSLWKSLPKFRWQSEAQFQGFLWTVVKRRIIRSWLRKPKIVSLEDIYDIPTEEDPKEDYRYLLKQLSLLKEKERLVVELRYFENLTFELLAETLGINVSNAKVLHHRALKKLRENLKNHV